MALPKILKNFNVFHNGENWMGKCAEFTIPKLARKMEAIRTGGMNGEVEVDLGMEKMESTQTYPGPMRQVYEQWGISKIDGVMLRFAGYIEDDDSEGSGDSIEVVLRGRYKEIDPGSSKAGDKSDFKPTMSVTYFKYSVNGTTVVEIDLVNFIEVVNGVDRLAEQRKAIGL
ncbi:phage major tail tube protein [Pandoraea sputorum]|uniref:Phage major tail tube protein n=1 Tax=Pandoraea sputorum TaxID=93222 RepID=A0A239SVV9_9BURK|nr:phage major tail tube protein [Pandoraea sputorum]AJC15151.1 phage major tail tube protein [Pandoraea sputorum]SNU89577.1 phage major tail tube protein [Pandoraea sputorum]